MTTIRTSQTVAATPSWSFERPLSQARALHPSVEVSATTAPADAQLEQKQLGGLSNGNLGSSLFHLLGGFLDASAVTMGVVALVSALTGGAGLALGFLIAALVALALAIAAHVRGAQLASTDRYARAAPGDDARQTALAHQPRVRAAERLALTVPLHAVDLPRGRTSIGSA